MSTSGFFNDGAGTVRMTASLMDGGVRFGDTGVRSVAMKSYSTAPNALYVERSAFMGMGQVGFYVDDGPAIFNNVSIQADRVTTTIALSIGANADVYLSNTSVPSGRVDVAAGGRAEVRNSIVEECVGEVVSMGYNRFKTDTCPVGPDDSLGFAVDRPLVEIGGVLVRPEFATSVLIDGGRPEGCQQAVFSAGVVGIEPLFFDARSGDRPLDGDGDGTPRCDIGPYEADDGLLVSAVEPLTTTESGGQATFTVALRSAPLGPVRVQVSVAPDTEQSVAPASLDFDPSDWSTPRTVTFTGLDDGVRDGDADTTITLSVDDAASEDVRYEALPDVALSGRNADDGAVSVTDAGVALDQGAPNGDAGVAPGMGDMGGPGADDAGADGDVSPPVDGGAGDAGVAPPASGGGCRARPGGARGWAGLILIGLFLTARRRRR